MHIFLREVLSYISEYEIDEQKIIDTYQEFKVGATKNMEPMLKASSNNKSISLKKFSPEDGTKLILENDGQKFKNLLTNNLENFKNDRLFNDLSLKMLIQGNVTPKMAESYVNLRGFLVVGIFF